MTTWKQLIPSNFLKQDDIGAGKLVRLARIEQMDVGQEGSPEFKPCAHFAELDKPLVLNSTNLQLMARIAGSDHIEDWMGRYFVLYVDPNVSYAGRLVGGIRVRAPKPGAALPVAPPQQPAHRPAAAAAYPPALSLPADQAQPGSIANAFPEAPPASGNQPPFDDSDIPF